MLGSWVRAPAGSQIPKIDLIDFQSVRSFSYPKNGLPCQPRVNGFSEAFIFVDILSENERWSNPDIPPLQKSPLTRLNLFFHHHIYPQLLTFPTPFPHENMLRKMRNLRKVRKIPTPQKHTKIRTFKEKSYFCTRIRHNNRALRSRFQINEIWYISQAGTER